MIYFADNFIVAENSYVLPNVKTFFDKLVFLSFFYEYIDKLRVKMTNVDNLATL